MKRRILCISILLCASAAAAAATAAPAAPGWLPTTVARAILDQDPAVAAARAGYGAAREEAGLAAGSPYEWNAKVAAQRRTVEAGPQYREWNAGIERTLRLPGKARADRQIGASLLEEGAAHYGAALHETARELLGLWLAWTHAEQGIALAANQVRAARANLASVEQRVKAGDAARLDAGLARAELAESQRAAIDASTASAVAWARLHARFPGLTRAHAMLPDALPLVDDDASWRARVLAQSDEIKVADALHGKARAQSERARADRVPDPTIGLYTASEVGGRERLTGISLSIPIPAAQRARRADREVMAAEMARLQAELARRTVDANGAAAIASSQGSYAGWQAAKEAQQEMAAHATLMQRAYQLGEADLPALLMAQRLATTAAQNALAAQLSAAQAYYGLLVDAHAVWDLAHE